jgi:hypothetical protein
MNYASPITVILSMLLIPSGPGCYASATKLSNIFIKGFSEKNYVALEKQLGKRICITGRLTIDSKGVYYPLQPIERDGVIDLSYSRINTGLNRSLSLRDGMRNGKIYTVCGLLQNATPFKDCESNDCKWYSLTAAKSLKKRFGFK